MADKPAQKSKSCCCKLISTCITTLYLFFLLYRPTPTISIESFDVSALDKTNRTLHYDLKLRNRSFKRIYYDALSLAFYYNRPNLSQYPIGNAVYPSFHQGKRKTAHRFGSFEVTTGVVSENGTRVFRVELATAFRYKIIFWNTKRHHLMVGGDLQVNDQGSLVKGKKNKGVKLMSSGAPRNNGCFYLRTILIFIYFL